jgi:hypothetical protein
LRDDEIAGVSLEPWGLYQRKESQEENGDNQCPIACDPTRIPPHPHLYMLSRPRRRHSPSSTKSRESDPDGTAAFLRGCAHVGARTGYGAGSRIHRRHLLTSADLPIMVCIIDDDTKIQAFLPTLERMVSEGLIAISEVEVIRCTHRASDAPS